MIQICRTPPEKAADLIKLLILYLKRRISALSAAAARSIADGYASNTWKKVGKIIQNWQNFWMNNGMTDTGIWFKSDK